MKKIKKYFLFSLSVTLSFSMIFSLASCSFENDKIFVANWESYIAPDLEEEIENNNNVDYKIFSSNEQARREFIANHHISIPSSYVSIDLIKNGYVEPINWGAITQNRILNAQQALEYFTDDLQNYLKSQDLNNNNILNEEEDNLLYWSIPYFAQDLIIGYKSNEAFLDGMSLHDAVKTIGEKTGVNKDFNRIAAVDDVRTMYGFSKRISGWDDINPGKFTSSINDFRSDYSNLVKYLNDDKVVFNTDSSVILNDFAADNGSDVIISYNGDFLYSTNGGDSGIVPLKKMQLYRPTDSISQAVELVIINKSLYNNLSSTSQNNVWDIMRKLAFDLPTETLDFKSDSFSSTLNWENSWSYKNFDYVNYTPTIKGLYEFVINEDYGYGFDELQLEIISTGEIKQNLVDKRIENIQQFNMQLAYMSIKSEM